MVAVVQYPVDCDRFWSRAINPEIADQLGAAVLQLNIHSAVIGDQ